MSDSEKPIPMLNNELLHRFEAHVDGHVAIAAYLRGGDHLIFTHTEVPDALRGQGIANKLIHYALEYAKSHNFDIVPRCPFVAAYVQRHPEYQSMVRAEA